MELLVVSNFGILLRCSWIKEYIAQFEQLNFVEVVRPYIKSPIPHIRALAVFTLSSIAHSLSKEQCILLSMKDKELDHIVVTLTETVSQNSLTVECFDLKFTRERVAHVLNKLCIIPENRQKMVNCNVVDTIALLLERGTIKEQEIALQLLWSLATEQKIRTHFNEKHPLYKLVVEMLGSSSVQNHQILSGCILWALNPGKTTGTMYV